MRLCTFTVPGVPVSQGSKVAMHVRRADGRIQTRMIESANRNKGEKRRLEKWRHAVGWAAKAVYRGRVVSGPVIVKAAFRFTRPRTGDGADPAIRPEHNIKPDLSKLIRAIEDALTGIVWVDDCQIIRLEATKAYASSPGVEISIHDLRPAPELAHPPGAVLG